MSEQKKKKPKLAELKVALIIKRAMQYKKENGQYPERRKLAQLTAIPLTIVQQVIREVEKSTGKLYARNLTDQERGQRSKQSREGKEYDIS